MKRTFTALAVLMLFGQMTWAADVFVKNTKTKNISSRQISEITQAVKQAVRNMPEHKLVQSENQADFVLQPTLIQDGNEQILRVEKLKNGVVIAMSEETLRPLSSKQSRAMAATETAMMEDQYVSGTTQSGSVSGATTGEIRGPSPRFANPDRVGYFTIGAGPSFGVNLDNDNVMYNINAGYNVDVTDRLTAKGFGDFNLSTGNDDARFINLGVGVNVYMTEVTMGGGRPYLTGDIGYAFVKTNNDDTKDALSGGVGAGFQFSAAQLNVDLSLHYSLLFAQINNDTPSVFGLRAGVNF